MNPFRDPLDLRVHPSPRLWHALVLLHLAAAVVTLVMAWRTPVLSILLLPVALSLVWYRRRLAGNAPGRIVRLQWRSDGQWRWEHADGRIGMGTLLGTSVSTRQIVVLHLRAAQSRRVLHLALLPDSVDDDAFRRLRVQLRLHGAHRVTIPTL